MINAHAANKAKYGGETMPEGMEDCSSCGWYGKESHFTYGLCPACAPDEDKKPLWHDEDYYQ